MKSPSASEPNGHRAAEEVVDDDLALGDARSGSPPARRRRAGARPRPRVSAAAATVVARRDARRRAARHALARGARRCRSSGRRAPRRAAAPPPPGSVSRRSLCRYGANGPPTSGPSSHSRPEPAQVVEDRRPRAGPRSAPRRCPRCAATNAAAAVAREQPVEQRRARRADVQRPRGARREAYSHRLVEVDGSLPRRRFLLQTRVQCITRTA